jgi:Ohr subfamily peroxiredoxin
MGGPGGGTNPEQLFAAAYGACFHGALSLMANRLDIPIGTLEVHVAVAFGRDPVDGLFMLTADLRVHIDGVERHVAEELVRHTERACPYTKLARQGMRSRVALAG